MATTTITRISRSERLGQLQRMSYRQLGEIYGQTSGMSRWELIAEILDYEYA